MRLSSLALLVTVTGPAVLSAQDSTRVIASAQPAVPQVLTRNQAVDLALTYGTQAALAAATARAAQAQLQSARAIANPSLNASYTKDVPQYHATVGLPLDFLTVRSARIASARSAAAAAQDQLALGRAAVRLTVDTLYTRAIGAVGHAALSHRDAVDADSLLTIARVRHDAGDASELDLELARVNAGQVENSAATDSLTAIGALLDLQAVLGLPAQTVTVTLADSLVPPTADSVPPPGGPAATPPPGTPLSVSAAEHELQSAEQSITAQHLSVLSGLSVTAGFDTHDPTGAERGLLPVVGVSVPLPILNQAQGEVALAKAERDRAQAELEAARRESAAAFAQGRRSLAVAIARANRDRTLVASAQRIAEMSLSAYAEGAYAVTAVLEAQRNARAALAQLIDDTAAAVNAAAALRFYATTTVTAGP